MFGIAEISVFHSIDSNRDASCGLCIVQTIQPIPKDVLPCKRRKMLYLHPNLIVTYRSRQRN